MNECCKHCGSFHEDKPTKKANNYLMPAALIAFAVLIGIVFFVLQFGGDSSRSTYLTFQAIVEDGNTVTSIGNNDFNSAERILRNRLDAHNVDVIAITSIGSGQITIEINGRRPGDEVIDSLGRIGMVRFNYMGYNIITSHNIFSAYAFMHEVSDIFMHEASNIEQPAIAVTFDASARTAFRQATRYAAAAAHGSDENRIFIYLDDEQISAPLVTNEIDSTETIITLGVDSTLQDARNLAYLINSGVLPFRLDLVDND